MALLQVASGHDGGHAVADHPLEAAAQLVIVDGAPSAELSSLSGLPDGVYVGGIHNAPSQAVSQNLVSNLASLCNEQLLVLC